MKQPCQIQLAHDILHAVVTHEIDLGFTQDTISAAWAAHDALSWVLGFPCGNAFEENLRTIMAAAERRGFTIGKARTSPQKPCGERRA